MLDEKNRKRPYKPRPIKRLSDKPKRAPDEFDLVLVEDLGRIHATQSELAAILKTTEMTVSTRLSTDNDFSRAWFRGRANGKLSLRRKQFELADKGDKTMLIWLGKQLLGQSDMPQPEREREGPPCLVTVLTGGRVLTVAPGDDPIEKFHELVHGEKPKEPK